LVIFLSAAISESAYSQSFYAVRRERNVIASFGTGNATYFGDLKNPGLKLDPKLNINIGLQYFVTPRISLRSEINWFQLSGSDQYANSDRSERNLSFYSNNFEGNVAGLIHLFPNRGGRFYRRVGINFYAFAGIGVFTVNPKTKIGGTTPYNGTQVVALRPLETEGVHYHEFQPCIPYGLGVKIKQGPYLNICIEGGYRTTFTDYIDDVSSTRYPNPATLKSPLSQELSDRRTPPLSPGVGKRGDPKNNDSYFLLNIKFEYYLPYSLATNRTSKFKIFNPRRKYNFNKRRYSR